MIMLCQIVILMLAIYVHDWKNVLHLPNRLSSGVKPVVILYTGSNATP